MQNLQGPKTVFGLDLNVASGLAYLPFCLCHFIVSIGILATDKMNKVFDIVKAAQTAAASATAEPPAPRPTARTSVTSSSTKRPSTTTRPRPAVTPTTDRGGAIEIMSRPRGAKVLLDGSVVGLAPMSIANVDEGTHDVRVELDGFRPWTGTVRVKGGSRARVAASLEP